MSKLSRRERAEMVVDWVEAEAERGEPITGKVVDLAVRRNSMTDSEHEALWNETMMVMRLRGYNVPEGAPIRVGPWILAGALGLAIWIGATLAVLKLLGTI